MDMFYAKKIQFNNCVGLVFIYRANEGFILHVKTIERDFGGISVYTQERAVYPYLMLGD